MLWFLGDFFIFFLFIEDGLFESVEQAESEIRRVYWRMLQSDTAAFRV